MEWKKSLKKLNELVESDQLVVFVGSGVSLNSGIASWDSIIDELLNVINNQLDHLNFYEKKSQDDYLKITQVASKEINSEYTKIIQTKLNTSNPPNLIDEEILNLQPSNIITTNLDQLLEKIEPIKLAPYSLIINDKDFFEAETNKYFIKMHGDINREETWVFTHKEYLDYELKHPLISLFIKSLLMTKSFLFIGYSLYDSDFQQIINWINEKKKEVNNNKKKYFFLSLQDKNLIQESIIESLDIDIIRLNNTEYKNHPIVKEIIDDPDIISKLDNDLGRLIYSYLHILNNPNYLKKIFPPIEIIAKDIRTLYNYNFVSIQDLYNVIGFGSFQNLGNILFLNENSDYEFLVDLLENSDVIREAFLRSSIKEIKLKNNSNKSFSIKEIYKPLNETEERFLTLAQKNNYIGIKDSLNENISKECYIYYSFNIGRDINYYELGNTRFSNNYESSNLLSLTINAIRNDLYEKDYKLWQTNYKIKSERELTIPQLLTNLNSIDQKAVSFFSDIYKGMPYYERKFNNILNKVVDKYIKNKKMVYFLDPMDELIDQAHRFYFFIKYNYFALDFKKETFDIFSKFIEGLFITQTDYKLLDYDYSLDEIDLDILTKLTHPSTLVKLKRKYNIETIKTKNTINILDNIKNLIESIKEIKYHLRWDNFLYNYTILFPLFDLSKEDGINLYEYLIHFLKDNSEKDKLYIKYCYKLILQILEKFNLEEYYQFFNLNSELLNLILENKSLFNNKGFNLNLDEIIDKISNYLTDKDKQKVVLKLNKNDLTNEQKENFLIYMDKLLPKDIIF